MSGIASIQGDDVTVADGTEENYVVPFYGYFADVINNVYGQMIYPAADLKSLVGKDITAIKFYSSTGIKFSGAKFDVTIGTTSLDEFSGTQRVAIPDGVTASVTPAKDAPEIEITFSEPFRYLGGNLIVDTYGTMRGTCDPDKGDTKYYGVNQTTNTAIHSKAGDYGAAGYAQFLPKITFSVSVPAVTDIATLKELCLNGEANKKYTIKEPLRAAYKNGNTVWFKDEVEKTIELKNETLTVIGGAVAFDEPGDEMNYWIDDVRSKDFDQSNWIEVVFPENLFSGELLHPGTDLDTDHPYVKVKNLTGIFTKENGRPRLEVLMAVASEDVTETEPYEPNQYIPANFYGSQQGYFFSKPKAQEYAKVVDAQWNGEKMVMGTNDAEFIGSFTIKPVEGLKKDYYYTFHGIISKNIAGGQSYSAPRLQAEGDDYDMETIDLAGQDGSTVTAISTIGINGNVKSVKYVNVAGVVSDRPFEGVNIVVTEYTDGSRTTVKMVR